MTKTRPLGVCDHCGGPIRRSEWYTSKRKPRRYCCRDCRNTANSRAGAPIRSVKILAHIRAGTWQNPHILHPPTPAEQAARARKGRLREVRAGRWRNPALTLEARRKLSRPRRHSGALHAAIEKLRNGKMADLTPEERDAYRAYRRDLARRKK